jgi:hypothetical protein
MSRNQSSVDGACISGGQRGRPPCCGVPAPQMCFHVRPASRRPVPLDASVVHPKKLRVSTCLEPHSAPTNTEITGRPCHGGRGWASSRRQPAAASTSAHADRLVHAATRRRRPSEVGLASRLFPTAASSHVSSQSGPPDAAVGSWLVRAAGVGCCWVLLANGRLRRRDGRGAGQHVGRRGLEAASSFGRPSLGTKLYAMVRQCSQMSPDGRGPVYPDRHRRHG